MTRIAFLVAACLLVLPAGASAGTVTATPGADGGEVNFKANPGERNHVAVTVTRAAVTITDTGAAVIAGDGCTQASADSASCAIGSFLDVFVALGDQNDTLSASYPGDALPLPIWADGGPGNDHLAGGRGNDHLNGGGGHDVILGGAGSDRISDGDVQRDGDAIGVDIGSDVIDGGPGRDGIDYTARMAALHVDLRRTGGQGQAHENDTLKNIESVYAGSGNDVLIGDAGGNVLWGGSGADRLIGNAGSDRLQGGPGADRIDGGAGGDQIDASEDDAYARPTRRAHDVIRCGSGRDTVFGADSFDRLSPDCEHRRS